MINQYWPQALARACVDSYHPGLHSRAEEDIVKRFLWRWGKYPDEVWPAWETIFEQGQDMHGRFEQDIFPILQRVLIEGEEEDRIWALFYLGGLATSEARDLLSSFLTSEHRKERWTSAIALGRLHDERVFDVLQTFLLDGFFPSEIFADQEELQRAQDACRLYRQRLNEQPQYADIPQIYWRVAEQLESTGYEWFLRQRSECALILGAWGNAEVIPKLSEALQAAWKMEQDWPDYEGTDESGPEIWYFFQDHLAFALGQCGVWDALSAVSFPEVHMLIARIYLILGALQINNPFIFYRGSLSRILHVALSNSQRWALNAKRGRDVDPFVVIAQVKRLLGEHFGLSPARQEEYVLRFPQAWYERATEGGYTPAPGQWRDGGPKEYDEDSFDPFLDGIEFIE